MTRFCMFLIVALGGRSVALAEMMSSDSPRFRALSNCPADKSKPLYATKSGFVAYERDASCMAFALEHNGMTPEQFELIERVARPYRELADYLECERSRHLPTAPDFSMVPKCTLTPGAFDLRRQLLVQSKPDLLNEIEVLRDRVDELEGEIYHLRNSAE